MTSENRRRTSDRPERWDASYRDGNAAEMWDFGRPQPMIAELAAAGELRAPLLDAGCGTGENALHLAAAGLEVTGFDWAATAIERARAKAAERGLTERAAFLVADALALPGELGSGRRFAGIVDCGLFHVFEPEERGRYLAGLGTLALPGAELHLLCFSDREPDWGGPHRISEEELRGAFAEAGAWRLLSVEPAVFALANPGLTPLAWHAVAEREDS